MTTAELLAEALGRIRGLVHRAVKGLSPEQLAARLDPDANSIGWLIWHLTRIQDDHVAAAAGSPQTYTEQGWAKRFGMPFPDTEIGDGHAPYGTVAGTGPAARGAGGEDGSAIPPILSYRLAGAASEVAPVPARALLAAVQ